jgi:hypothetical protein
MPRARRAPKRSRVKPEPDPVFEIVKRMHLPMIEARAFLSALYLMGYGMNELGSDDGDTVKTLAEAARERLEIIDDGVHDLIQAARN